MTDTSDKRMAEIQLILDTLKRRGDQSRISPAIAIDLLAKVAELQAALEGKRYPLREFAERDGLRAKVAELEAFKKTSAECVKHLETCAKHRDERIAELEAENKRLRTVTSSALNLIGESRDDKELTIDNLLERLTAKAKKAKDAPK